jgi:hypothetical protein
MLPSPAVNTYPQYIQQLSRVLAAACLILIVTLPIAVVGYWLVADASQLAVRAQLPVHAIQAPLLAWQRWSGALVTLVPVVLLSIGLWEARQCFRRFIAGEVFSAHTVRCLRRFAGWVVVSVAASMVAATAVSVLLTLNNPPGLRHVAISIGTDQLFTLFFAGMVWLMAAVIGQGQALAEDNAAII